MAIPRMRGEAPRDLSKRLEEVHIRIDAPLDGERLDVALREHLTWRSRTSILELIDAGLVHLPGRRARKASRVRKGDVITVRIPARPEPEVPIAPDDAGIAILYQDKGLVAVDKPAGLAVHPAGKRVYGTLIHWLHTRFRRPDDPAHDVVPRLLHRIDRETSGLILASLDPDLHSAIGQQFEARTVQKAYQAVVHGRPPCAEGIVDHSIGPDHASAIRLKLEARRDGSGQPALTHYRLLGGNARYSLVELRPRTGRTHQLRVHMAAIGCPLVGDKVYGVEDRVFLEYLTGSLSDDTRELLVLDRHALHSAALTFFHPCHGEEMTLRAPLPSDLAALIS
jgi:23S rRNA pseudouridine1911/1915/1917 synthase